MSAGLRRQAHLNKLVCTAGVVTRRTGVFPQLQRIKFDCGRCGYVLGPFFQNTGEAEIKPNSCPQCQGKGPFPVRIPLTTLPPQHLRRPQRAYGTAACFHFIWPFLVYSMMRRQQIRMGVSRPAGHNFATAKE